MQGRRLADSSGMGIGSDDSGRLFFKDAVQNGISIAKETGRSYYGDIPVAYFSYH